MRKLLIPLTLLLCIALMAACGQTPAAESVQSGGNMSDTGSVLPQSDNGIPQSAEVILLCRVIDESDGTLLLAGQGEQAAEVYDLSVTACELTLDGKSTETINLSVQEGTLVEVHYDGMVLETYPGQLPNVARLNLRSDGFDDLCEVYLEALDDLWEVDSGLNSDVTQLGVDLSKTRLLPAERAAVAVAFGREHGILPVEGTFEELTAQGYITATPLGGDAPEGAAFYEWKDGILFSITEEESAGNKLEFTAQKWRTSRGAYGFSGCKSKQDAAGLWSDYTVEAQFVS